MGKYENELLEDIQCEMKKMLKSVVSFLEKNNLTYWIDSGTLLGARRHGGFIPWDDDIDICMPREDYNKLINMNLTEEYEELYIETGIYDSNTILWTKVRNKNISIVEKDKVDEIQNLFIDIFPVDFCRNSYNERIIRNVSRGLILINWKRKQYKYVSNINNTILKYIHKNNTIKHGNYIMYGIETPFVNTWSKESVFPLRRIVFDGLSVYSPNKVDEYLTNLYGEDYMSLPPESERQAPHIVKIIKN